MITITDKIKLPPLPPHPNIAHEGGFHLHPDCQFTVLYKWAKDYARSAVEADRQARVNNSTLEGLQPADRQGRMPSDEDILEVWTGDPTHSRPVPGKDKVITFAHALLSRYGSSHPAVPDWSSINAIIAAAFGDDSANAARAQSVVSKIFAIGSQPAASAEPVAYLDIGKNGYLDLGSHRNEDWLMKLPSGRHMLGIIGTYGEDGKYRVAPVAQEPVAEVVEGGMFDGLAWTDAGREIEPWPGTKLYSTPVPAQSSVLEYTSAMGEAAQRYLDHFPHAHPLPAMFRWNELWDEMQSAVPTSPASEDQK